MLCKDNTGRRCGRYNKHARNKYDTHTASFSKTRFFNNNYYTHTHMVIFYIGTRNPYYDRGGESPKTFSSYTYNKNKKL